MGTVHSHSHRRETITNGAKETHYERITKNSSGLSMSYCCIGDDGTQKIDVTKKRDKFCLDGMYGSHIEKGENGYSREELLKILKECAEKDNLKFMVEYLQTHEK